MQPREPRWDKPGLSVPAAAGCALLLAVVAASGISFWLIRSGRLQLPMLDRPIAAAPTPTIEAPATVDAPEPTPEPTPVVADVSYESVDAQMQKKIREMEAALENARHGGREVYGVGGEVTAPVVISRVEPKYTEA